MRSNPRQNAQRGMALLIALVVLVVVSVLGATAMKLALFQNRVSINTQIEQYLFQTAESGLQAAGQAMFADLPAGAHPLSDQTRMLARAINGEVIRVCLDEDGVPQESAEPVGGTGWGDDPDDARFDDRVPCEVQDGQNFTVTGFMAPPPPDIPGSVPIEGYDINGNFSLQQVYTRGASTQGGAFARAFHVQLWGVRGVSIE